MARESERRADHDGARGAEEPGQRRSDAEERRQGPTRGDVLRTWSILAGLMLAYAIWFGTVYLLEPGLR